jgi:hypothetical protein
VSARTMSCATLGFSAMMRVFVIGSLVSLNAGTPRE